MWTRPTIAVEVALAEREAGVAGAPRDLQVLLHRARGREVDHVGARHHDLAGDAVRELEDVGEQVALLVGQRRLCARSRAAGGSPPRCGAISCSVTGAMPKMRRIPFAVWLRTQITG